VIDQLKDDSTMSQIKLQGASGSGLEDLKMA
jgi:hypothetical protein